MNNQQHNWILGERELSVKLVFNSVSAEVEVEEGDDGEDVEESTRDAHNTSH